MIIARDTPSRAVDKILVEFSNTSNGGSKRKLD